MVYKSNYEDVCTVNQNGKITGTGKGSALIEAVSKKGDKKDTIKVIVSDNRVSSVEINIESAQLFIGQVMHLSAEVFPESAVNRTVNWYSLNPSIVKVTPDGKISASVLQAISFGWSKVILLAIWSL